MDFVLTLVASGKTLTTAHLAVLTRYLDSQGISLSGEPRWLAQHKAADLYTAARPNFGQMQAMREALMTDKIDILVNRTRGRKKKLLLADMDSTIIQNETLDELAAKIGKREECAVITERTMRGDLDLHAAIRERVALLRGLSTDILRQVLDDLAYTPGAETLVRGMRQHGALCVLASSGFTCFTGDVAARLGFVQHHGNTLEIENDILTGAVVDPILDKNSKLSFLHHYRAELGLEAGDVMAIGDGSNDLLMLEAAGLGIGFHPKPILAERLDNLILHGDLTAALYAQGLVPNRH